MNEREETVKLEILIMRGLARLEATMYDRIMVEAVVTDALISEKNQASRLYQLYEGVAGLGRNKNQPQPWVAALTIARDAASASADSSPDEETRLACQRFMRQTKHLCE